MRKLKKVPEWWRDPFTHASYSKEYKLADDPGKFLTHDKIDGKDRFSLHFSEKEEEFFYKLTQAEFASFILEGVVDAD